MTIEQAKKAGINIMNVLPDGWKINAGATTSPCGYKWISNGSSLFGGTYRHALLKINHLD